MDTQHPSAPPRAQSRLAADNHPNRRLHTGGGLIHENTRHTERFVVIGNHLTQHPELSLLAIGLGCHIQSLPRGARVDIKSLTARFQEGATRIAAGLRELETHGYLRRERERVSSGRIVTRTISCNQPGSRRPTAGHAPARSARPGHGTAPVPATAPVSAAEFAPAIAPVPGAEPVAAPAKRQAARKKSLPEVPQPACPAPLLLRQAADLLAALHRHDPRLLLSTCDTAHLAPGVAAWLEREVSPAAVRHALTAHLPDAPLCRPAALLAHRLAAQLPPPPPFRAQASPSSAARHPLRNCDGCDRAFRSPAPGRCHDCRTPVAA
ncbi:helix-turn-helix domain-containing protein [Streptomyces fuscichromogenes]|uniref:DNA-binding protein n=1 Tax=Streptomyces fuscichromogenes TaxID=1324013 RepID=A0A918CVX0_9ACTN|nr:helix-turn-helix domain-containing protein [Streptomyces fuscichromogenes]GGN35951.1 DNA-binding protein [Streptomyces fuscichromogenes]